MTTVHNVKSQLNIIETQVDNSRFSENLKKDLLKLRKDFVNKDDWEKGDVLRRISHDVESEFHKEFFKDQKKDQKNKNIYYIRESISILKNIMAKNPSLFNNIQKSNSRNIMAKTPNYIKTPKQSNNTRKKNAAWERMNISKNNNTRKIQEKYKKNNIPFSLPWQRIPLNQWRWDQKYGKQ